MTIEINDSNFTEEVLSSDKLVLVDFWAPWCGPCKMLSPIIEELSIEYTGKVKIVKINTDENTSLSSKFQITSIPCLILFKNGISIEKVIGLKSKNNIKKIIDAALRLKE
jgi:thioredoxin 1